jgi:SOS-response transcriptional repressor LexA
VKNFEVNGKVFVYPGEMGWHFIYLDKKLAEKIKKIGKIYGGGFVKIKASIRKTSWDTALFPYSREKTFLLAIKKSVRQKEGIVEGDEIKVKVALV